MRRTLIVAVTLAGLALLVYQSGLLAEAGLFANGLLPPVPIPVDNPQTDAKLRLGKQLYFDKRLSSDGTVACVTCHRPDAGWADTEATSTGVGHKRGGRNSPSVLNGGYFVPQFWDGRALHLEKQAVGPVQNPVEMDQTPEQVAHTLGGIPGYVTQFQEVFGEAPSLELVAKAIASFERTIVSTNSAYDKYLQGDDEALSPAARRGMDLFNGKGHCTPCHSGPLFSDQQFHNLGIGYQDGKFADVGRFAVSNRLPDTGAFRTPSLRSVALTAPYLHDGSAATLLEVIELYDRGSIQNPYLDPLMEPLNLTRREKLDLVAFLQSLTGEPIKGDPPVLPE
ncbi:MAG TPA: cytochrome c peroxidase [Armatimonadota bacterium]|jgi:cytochrome c peroxidase